MEVVLIRVTEDGRQQAIPINRPKTVIGRHMDCQVRAPLPGVSRKHLEIRIEDGEITVTDLKSSNGTWVNQDRIESETVQAGDLISFGNSVFVVRVDGKPEEIDAEICFEDGIPEDEQTVVPSPASAAIASPSAPKPSDNPTSSLLSGEDSSVIDFDFDFDDDDDEQPPL